MKKSERPSDEEIKHLIQKYSNTLYKAAFVTIGSDADAQDAVQDAFLKYLERLPDCRNEEHLKAWLIRVTINNAKDKLRFHRRLEQIPDNTAENKQADSSLIEVLDAVMRLPAKQKIVLYLSVSEGYSNEEISKILKLSPATVRKRMQYARDKLKIELN